MDPDQRTILQFAPFQSVVDEGFWHRLSSLKLNRLGIDETPIPVTGFYAPCSYHMVSNRFTLVADSLPDESSKQVFLPEIKRGNRSKCPVPGILYNTNTLEGFQSLDKQKLMKIEGKKIFDDICCGKVEEDPSVLLRFLLITFVDLKKWTFHYWFAFPALVLDPSATLSKMLPASEWFSKEELESLKASCNIWRATSSTTDIPFFLVSIPSNSSVTIRHLSEFDECLRDGHKLLFGFYDHCHLPKNAGWPLRNFLWFIARRCKLQKIMFFCYREKHGFADMESSLVGEASVSNSQDMLKHQHLPNIVGWELNNRGKKASRFISLVETMEPARLAIAAADLNLKLMRWRQLPSLDLNTLSSTKCLLIGAGTLGCQVARMLMAWGVHNITLVDSGKVSMSNPLRQSLYTLDDCLNGGEYKATAAVKSLNRIYPAVRAEPVIMAVPMPGHPIPSTEENSVLEDCRKLQDLISSHDVVFLLTDTRESRWLPSLLCADANKITITAALGFDSFLVMRHGAGPLSNTHDIETNTLTCASTEKDSGRVQRLGCYFCNDVVAPIDSTSNRTLDQQCTVTRPGLAPIASSLAVELVVGILHHPSGIFTGAEFCNSNEQQPLGILPHQIRGSISQFSQMNLVGHASNTCTACSSVVVSEYRSRGLDFVVEAINHPTYLEDITGLTDLINSANSFDLDWADDQAADIETDNKYQIT